MAARLTHFPCGDAACAATVARVVPLSESMDIGRVTTASAAMLFAAALQPERAAAQRAAAPPVTAIGDTVVVTPSTSYRAGGLKRVLLGSGWRDLWSTPVDVPVFDMGTHAGGLDVVRRGGGFQSITLHLVETAGWREYRYRSVDKFPQQAMPPAIQGTLAGAVLQDQVSTLFPAAPLLVTPLIEAIGALHVVSGLYIMPDDPRLGEHRDVFPGMLGTVELKPDDAPDGAPGFAGSRTVRGSENFLRDLESGREHRLDEREFLAVRLIDFLVNDSDRTRDNFEWARFDGANDTYVWRPVARDRDRAFMDARGWVNAILTQPIYPKLVAFTPEFPLSGLTHTSFVLDRRLLQRLTRSDFEDVARRVQSAITNDVIEAVILQLPARWRAETDAAERLRQVLTARRDSLSAVALAFYRDLAGEVDVFGTADDDRADVVRHRDGSITVTITGTDEDRLEIVRHDNGSVSVEVDGPVFYRRNFTPDETNEIRLYLGGGNDHAVVRGAPTHAIAVRVIGGAGDDVLVDSAGGGATFFYDAEGDNTFITAAGTHISRTHWTPPEPSTGLRLGRAWRPDWGGSASWSPTFDYADGSGIVVGFGPDRRRYGFRRLPHHWSADAKLMAGLRSGRLAVRAELDHRAENSPLALALAVRASQIEAYTFHGFGNASQRVARDVSLVRQNSVAVEPTLTWHIGWRSREGLSNPIRGETRQSTSLRPLVGQLDAGPAVYWSDSRPTTEAGTDSQDVIGGGRFGRVGLRLGLELERTDDDPVPTRGWTFSALLAGYPAVWDVRRSFSTAAAVGSAYLPLAGSGPHIAVRAGANMGSGALPVQHASTIGGRTTLRGYAWQRFTGDAAAYGSTELRVPTGSVSLFVRWQAGVFGLADVGRVWHDGDSPGGWHTGLGGGFWLSSLGQGVSIAYAHGEAHRIYVNSGMSF